MLSCGVRGCGRAARYQFGAGRHAPEPRCLRHALTYQPVAARAIRLALVVGTILFAINQADVVLSGQLTAMILAKVGLTYLVPFSVSTYSALAANRLAEA